MSYELILILKPEVAEEARKAEIEKIKGLIAAGKGEIVKEDVWGQRVLAYPVKNFSEGFYHLLDFKSSPAKIKELEGSLTLDEEVLRFLIIKED